MSLQSRSPSLVSSPPSPLSSSSSSSCHDNSYTRRKESLDKPVIGIGRLSLQDQELMMHWCSSTYRSLSQNSSVEHIWQAVIPQESLQHAFLKHGILALSALHLASSSTSNNGRVQQGGYLKTAQAHHTQAMTGLRQAIKNLNTFNRTAVFASYSIMMIYQFAFSRPVVPTTQQHSDDALENVCAIFLFSRESMTMLRMLIDSDQDNELGPLMTNRDDLEHPKMPNMSRLAILCLQQQNASLSTEHPNHETEVYNEAIEHLGNALENLSKGGEVTSIAFRWIFQIPTRFLDLLRDRQPFALVILAHYAVIMHNLRRQWWMGQWGTRILREICIQLDSKWVQSITWAVDATGFCISGSE